MRNPFKRKRRTSLLMQTVEEMDEKLDSLISQMSHLAAAKPALAEKQQLAPGAPDVEPFTAFEPFTAEDQT